MSKAQYILALPMGQSCRIWVDDADRYGPFIVHPAGGSGRMTVTHTPSGCAVQAGMERARAKALAAYLQEHVPLSESHGDIFGEPHKDTVEKVRKAFDDFNLTSEAQ